MAEQTIQSSASILAVKSFAILSNSAVLAPVVQTIDSSGQVLSTSEQTINSFAQIKEPQFLFAKAQVDVPQTDEIVTETDLSNPVPSAPTSLVASDAGIGDVVNLTWSSTAKFFNVYRKDGIVLTKLNPVLLGEISVYAAGGLDTGIAVTFVVKALNGLGQESLESNEATATPTFQDDLDRFTEPTWEVKVNTVVVPDAILSDVNLGFGSDMSSASFTIPRDPRLSGLPELNDDVDVVVNGRLIFRGVIKNISKDISSKGLSATYTCNSTIIDLTDVTLAQTGLDGGISRFNIVTNCPDGSVSLRAAANAASILDFFGVTGGPNVYPGYVDVTDSTKLSAAELVLSRVGNYKVYHDMSTGTNSAYAFGNGGFNVRKFTVGENIIEQSIKKSDLDVVKRVEVVGAPTKTRFKRIVSNFTTVTDPNGRLRAKFRVTGKNIKDIQVFGNIRAKPEIVFNDAIQVTLADFEDLSTLSQLKFKQQFEDFDNTFSSLSRFQSNTNNIQSTDLILRPDIKEIITLKTQRQPISAKIVYTGCDTVDVFLDEIPKLWFPRTKTGFVKRGAISSDLENPDEEVKVRVLLEYDFLVSSAEIEYTVDGTAPIAFSGTGTPVKTITDSQYQIVVNTISHSDNTSSVLTQMATRSNSELARFNKPVTSGSITIIGDETVDLRSSIDVDGENLEISGVRHTFTNGFRTTVELTNEPFFRTIVFPPALRSATNAKEAEKSKKGFTINLENRGLAEVAKELQSETDKNDRQPRELGSTSIAL